MLIWSYEFFNGFLPFQRGSASDKTYAGSAALAEVIGVSSALVFVVVIVWLRVV